MSNYLADRRKELGLTQKDVASFVGVSEGTVSRWESGEIANMRRDKINLYAKVLKTTPAFIMTGELPVKAEPSNAQPVIPPGFEPLPKMVKVPLVGSIACGEPITAEENLEGYIDAPEDVRCDFALTCKGDSMIDAGITDGDVVYIRSQPEVANGEIAAVRLDGEATLKRVYLDGDQLTLMPANAKYPPKTYSGVALEGICIEGKAVAFTHWFEKG
ncbi:MAG: LexA family transcriptional regulator [Clostridiales bacterium]|nr:LexA family transcriptional regulator [Clostridiales bacterium]